MGACDNTTCRRTRRGYPSNGIKRFERDERSRLVEGLFFVCRNRRKPESGQRIDAGGSPEVSFADDWEVRTRVLVTAMDDSPTIATMTKRAMILKDFSKGSSEKLVYTVQGWRQSNGELWQVNRLTQVKDGITDVFGEYLITAVTYELGPQGTTTRLELMHPHALLNTEFKSSKDAVKKSLGFKKKGKTENADWTTT